MKHNLIFYTIALLMAVSTLSSCDKIDADERFIALPAVEAKRVVILEEFTGQQCVNCPKAHVVIRDLLAQYPDNLISVSMHAGGPKQAFYEDEIPGVGLATAEGDAYYAAYNVGALPAGVVNRTSGVTTSDQWASKIREALEKPTDVDVEMDASYNQADKNIEINTTILAYNNYKCKLELWVVESGIISMQLDGNQMVMDYEHNHVFRGTVNGVGGETITLVPREAKSFAHKVAVKDTWNPANVEIVAIISDNSGVLQAWKTHVKSN